MKSISFLLLLSSVFVSSILFAQSTKTEKLKVYGNCAICKKNIETASNSAGATSANWNKKTKWLTVTYDPAKVSNEQIQKKIAAVGYDTENFRGDDKAYNELDACCQYDRKPVTPQKKQ
ncbi:MAG: heavy-metal-associated domain-containing protein [Flavisolibacter sp.]